MTGSRDGTPVQMACLDMAGTTVADGGVVVQAFTRTLDELGVAADGYERRRMEAYVRDTMGTAKIDVFRTLFPDEPEAQRANAAFESALEALVRGGALRALPGAEDTFARLRRAGVRVVLTTGFSVRTRQLLMEVLGWGELVDLALSPADAGRGRPYPDMILAAVVRLQVDAVEAVAVAGDTAADMESGRRAGAPIRAGVLTGADDRARLLAGGATHVLGSVADLPPLLGID